MKTKTSISVSIDKNLYEEMVKEKSKTGKSFSRILAEALDKYLIVVEQRKTLEIAIQDQERRILALEQLQ